MPENEPLSDPHVKSRVDDMYRAFLSRFEEKRSDGEASLPDRAEADSFLRLVLEEVESVVRSLEALNQELGRLSAPRKQEQQRFEALQGDLSRARKRLGQISSLRSHITRQPRPWALPEMFEECLGFLRGETRHRDIEISIVGRQGIPPVSLRHPSPQQALFAMLHGMVESFPTPGGRIVIRLSGVGDRVWGEVVAFFRGNMLERNGVPLASLLPLWIADGVRIERQVSPGRFLLRLGFPCAREGERERTTNRAAPASHPVR
jgi:hypothetical protein